MNNHALKIIPQDYRVHVAKTKSRQVRPPYSEYLQITAQSVFRDNTWHYSHSDLPAGHKGRGRISFLRPVKLSNQKISNIDPVHNETLLQQLKEATCAFIFLRNTLASRQDFVKPCGVVAQANLLIVFFANVAAAGFRSLADLSPKDVQQIFAELPNAPLAHNLLIDVFRDLITLSKKKLISNGLKNWNFSIAERAVIEDLSSDRRAGGYNEEQITFLLSTSKLYVNYRSQIADQLRRFRQKEITRRTLLKWAHDTLPLRKPLGRKHGHKQLAWLVRLAVYNLIAFALSSRCSEVLSAKNDFIRAEEDFRAVRRVIVELTIAKGTTNGRKQEYIVHPYLALVADTIRLLNEALGETGPYAFMKNGGKYISVNEINRWLKTFVEFHSGAPNGRYTTHKWRYTMPDLLVMTVKHPLPLIQERLGHEYISESIGYGFGGPSGKQLQEAALGVAANAAENFVALLDQGQAFGGREGLRLSESKARGMGTLGVVDDLIASGTVPLEIEPGKFCLKQSDHAGECAATPGDTLPNSERCRSTCRHQFQDESHYREWKAAIDKLPTALTGLASTMEKVRHAQLIKEALIAWPSLNSDLAVVLEEHPTLRVWFK